MMYYDLNVSYTTNQAELQRVLAFLAERQSYFVQTLLKGPDFTQWAMIQSH